jgi:hypothetical protein
VLTVVDNLTGARMLVRRCTTAKIRAALKQLDAIACVSQRASGGETSKSATDDCH